MNCEKADDLKWMQTHGGLIKAQHFIEQQVQEA